MKRLIVSLILIGAVLLICGYGISFVMSNYEDITLELSKGEEYMNSGDFDKAKEHCVRAEEIYRKNEQYMAAFVNHGILDEIGATLSGVAPLADKDSIPEFFSLCAEARTALMHLRNDHMFLIGNLF